MRLSPKGPGGRSLYPGYAGAQHSRRTARRLTVRGAGAAVGRGSETPGLLSGLARSIELVSEPVFSVQAEDQPSWAEIVRHAEHGESVSVIAHGEHVAEIVPSGELDRLRETIEVLSDSELVRDLREGLADARDGRVFSADQIAADLAARRAAGG